MDPATIAVLAGLGLFAGVGNLFSTNTTNKANLRMTQLNNATNLAISDRNNALQQQLFNQSMDFNANQAAIQRNYNSEVSQAQRLRAAGINPALAMSAGAQSGIATSPSAPALNTPTMQPSHFDAPQFDASGAQGIAQLMSSITNSHIGGAQIDALAQQVKESVSRTAGNDIQNQLTKLQAEVYADTMDAQKVGAELTNRVMNQQILESDERIRNMVYDRFVKSQQLEIQFQQLGISKQQADAMCKYYSESINLGYFSANKQAETSRYSADKSYKAVELKADTDLYMFGRKLRLDKKQVEASINLLNTEAQKLQLDMRYRPLDTAAQFAGAFVKAVK